MLQSSGSEPTDLTYPLARKKNNRTPALPSKMKDLHKLNLCHQLHEQAVNHDQACSFSKCILIACSFKTKLSGTSLITCGHYFLVMDISIDTKITAQLLCKIHTNKVNRICFLPCSMKLDYRNLIGLQSFREMENVRVVKSVR